MTREKFEIYWEIQDGLRNIIENPHERYLFISETAY